MKRSKSVGDWRGRVPLVVLLALVVGVLPTAGGTAVDLTVAGVEVTQAIQTTTNSIQLVARRATAIRATIGISGAAGPIAGVTGALHVFVNGTAITPSAGVPPINAPFTAPAAPQRANENDTLNFELLAPTGITASTDVDFRVDITPVAGETNTANNAGFANNLTFVNRTTPSLYFTRINWTPSGLGLPALADVQPGRGDAFVRGIFPVNDGDPNLYRQGLFPSLTFTEDANGDGALDLNPEGNNLLSLLASCRQLIVSNGLGAANNTFLYGWVSGNPINGNGWSQISGFDAFGNTQASRYQRTYAHELVHNFGIGPHNTRLLDQVGWDVGARLPNNPGGNNTTGRVKPTTLNDVMVAGQLTNTAWVDTITYNFLLGSGIISAPDAGGDKPRERVLVIQGIFDPEGRRLVRLEPAFRFPWFSQPASRRQRGQFAVQVTDSTGGVTTIQFDARVGDDSARETAPVRIGFFEVAVPVSPQREVVSLRITDGQRERQFASIKRSRPPRITITVPRPGQQLGERTRITWQVRDPDTPLRQLLYQIAYSPDGGRSWVPIAVDVPGTTTSIVFDSTEIQQSRGDGAIRVFVSDGLNTAFATVGKLTPRAARYRGR